MRKYLVPAFVLALLFAPGAAADPKLPGIFGDHMVLQRGRPVPVWGTADPGEAITVSVADQKGTVEADKQGTWKVQLKPLQAGGPLQLTVAGKTTVTLTDVLVGEVWVCSGQSNMAWPLRAASHAKAETAEAAYPKIRLFSVPHQVAQVVQDDCGGSWALCGPETVPGFSAVGYFFGRELHKELDVPVGLIHSSWGGTPAEAWTERSFLEKHNATLPILARWLRTVEQHPEAMERYQEKLTEYKEVTLAKWEDAVKKAKAEGKQPPRKPRPPRRPTGPNHPHYPSGLYNAMVAPLAPFAIRGAIWYQGESNAGRAYQYRTLFPAMIRSWRQAWGQGDFPFLYVQLANFLKVDREPTMDPWPELREAQAMTLELPNTAMACIIDVGEHNDIHPRNKQTVGQRLARAGLAVAYDRDIVYSGPTFDSMVIDGGKAIITFAHVGSGLVAKPFEDPVTPYGPTLQKRFGVDNPKELRPDSEVLGFAIAGKDNTFVWAKAKLQDHQTVVVWSEEVAKPVAVRYAWANNPICNLYNKEGLPAVPFRTDDVPGVTVDNR
ncbi:MAG: sialate O-acetylesterase [Candidatus Brocadiia bacterium]